VKFLWMHLYIAVPMTLSAAVSYFGRRRYQPFCLKYFWQPLGPLVRVCEVSMGAAFHSSSNDPIGIHVGHHAVARDITVFSHGVLVLATWFAVLQKEQTSVVTTA
jgi:hypothetical protein